MSSTPTRLMVPLPIQLAAFDGLGGRAGMNVVRDHGPAPLASYARTKDSQGKGGTPVTGYRPMTLADLASRLARMPDSKTGWKLVWEFLEEYRWEAADARTFGQAGVASIVTGQAEG
jgi:hypothetical protein